MYFSSSISTISSVSSMSSSTASSPAMAMDIRPRSSSSFSSSSGYAMPYRSSIINATSSEEPSSYLTDEDLFFSCEEDAVASPETELSTEDHIALLRKAAEQPEAANAQMWWNQQLQHQPRRYSRPQPEEMKRKTRPATGKRKKSTTKKVIFATPAQAQG